MRKLIALLLALSGAWAMGSRAADAPAGTVIVNTVDMTYMVSGSPLADHAVATLTVAQLVNVTVSWQNSSDVGTRSTPQIAQTAFKLLTRGCRFASCQGAEPPHRGQGRHRHQ